MADKKYNFGDFMGDIALGAGGRVPKYAAQGAGRPELTGVRESEFKNSLEEPFRQAMERKRENDNLINMMKFQEAVQMNSAKRDDMLADQELARKKQEEDAKENEWRMKVENKKLDLQRDRLAKDESLMTLYRVAQAALKVPPENRTPEEQQVSEDFMADMEARGYAVPRGASAPGALDKFLGSLERIFGAKSAGESGAPAAKPVAGKPAGAKNPGGGEWVEDADGNMVKRKK